jgi:hypothetical protein
MARERLLVMNGSRILQAESGANDWQNLKVMPGADGLKPGFYNLFSAQKAEAAGQYQGPVVHADKSKIFQQVGKALVVHEAGAFKQTPTIGKAYAVAYSNGSASVIEGLPQARGRGI